MKRSGALSRMACHQRGLKSQPKAMMAKAAPSNGTAVDLPNAGPLIVEALRVEILQQHEQKRDARDSDERRSVAKARCPQLIPKAHEDVCSDHSECEDVEVSRQILFVLREERRKAARCQRDAPVPCNRDHHTGREPRLALEAQPNQRKNAVELHLDGKRP